MTRKSPRSTFPSAWYAVAYSDEVGADHVRTATYFGEDLFLSRGDDGDVTAHAACPRHDVVRSWPVLERNGIVLVHFDAERRPPTSIVPEIPELASEHWMPLQRLDRRARLRFERVPPMEGVVRATRHGPGCSIARREVGHVPILVLAHATPIHEDLTHIRLDVLMRRVTAEQVTRSLLEILGASSGVAELSADTAARLLRRILAGDLGRRLERDVWLAEQRPLRVEPTPRAHARRRRLAAVGAAMRSVGDLPQDRDQARPAATSAPPRRPPGTRGNGARRGPGQVPRSDERKHRGQP